MTATDDMYTTETLFTQNGARAKESIQGVYDFIADEYDQRIPGLTPADHRFTETETDFVLSKVSSDDEVLDVGCGTGRLTVQLAGRAARTVGLDISAGMLQQAREKVRTAGLHAEFHEGDMCHLPFENSSFDVVTSMLALMHIPVADRHQVFAEVARVLRPGGRAVFGVKNAVFEQLTGADRFASVDITDVSGKTLIFTATRDGQERRAAWASFSPEELNRLFASVGMITVHLRGNSSLSAWLADGILADPGVYNTVRALESVLADTPPFNRLGYHVLIEAVKPR
jgi:ubiquinone/menaquinone biosynthesis C-methylase UbiE